MKPLLNLILLITAILLFVGCKKESDDSDPVKTEETANINLSIDYIVDDKSFIFDSLIYVNDAGNMYEVNRLEYYISNITFHSGSGKKFSMQSIHYVNAATPATNLISIQDLPIGVYDSMTFLVGIDSAHNVSYSLPNTAENVNMAWPDMMGGGYHFMKFEGYYKYGTSNRGYTLHLGENFSLVKCVIQQPLNITSQSTQIKLRMNLNEWFRSPHLYDFNIDGNMIMSNKPARIKMAANGWNIFSIE